MIGRWTSGPSWLAIFVLLSLVYASGVLRSSALPRLAGPHATEVVNSAPRFDQVSESLVENRIDLRFAGLADPSGFLLTVRSDGRVDPRILDTAHPDRYAPDWRPDRAELAAADRYRSQIGLQGRVYAGISDTLGLDRASTYAVLRAASAAALAAMLALLVVAIGGAWGRTAALAALGFCVVATGFNLFAPRLYWVTSLHVAPTVVATLLAFGRAGRGAHVAGFAAMSLLFAGKFASGYEFLTVTISAAAVPFFIAFAAGRIPLKTAIVYAAAVLTTGIAAFVGTLGLYDALHQDAFGTSGLVFLRSRSGEWSGVPFVGPFGTPLQMVKVGAINTVDVAGVGVPNALVVAAGLPFVIVAARALLRRSFDSEPARIAVAVSAAMLASVSWMLFQFPHISFHPRYSSILLAFPYGIVLAAALGRMWHLRRRGRAR